MSGYSGYANYETWAVCLYLQTDEFLYDLACRSRNFAELLNFLTVDGISETPDGIRYLDDRLDIDEINEVIAGCVK